MRVKCTRIKKQVDIGSWQAIEVKAVLLYKAGVTTSLAFGIQEEELNLESVCWMRHCITSEMALLSRSLEINWPRQPERVEDSFCGM